MKKVAIIMGSDSDTPIIRKATDMLVRELSTMPSEAGNNLHPQFYCWWHLSNTLGILEERLNGLY